MFSISGSTGPIRKHLMTATATGRLTGHSIPMGSYENKHLVTGILRRKVARQRYVIFPHQANCATRRIWVQTFRHESKEMADTAIRADAARKPAADMSNLIEFIPFDPATNMSEATATDSGGANLRIVKGAFVGGACLAESLPDASASANQLEAQGFRVLGVATSAPSAMRLAMESLISAILPDRIPPLRLRNCTRWACVQ
jgi:hypothetical protein